MRESRWDIADVARVFRYYAGLADKEAGAPRRPGDADRGRRIVYEPVGVCGLIGPWNYPLLQMSWKVAPALAAGNTIVMKPASADAADDDPPDAACSTRPACRPGVVNLVLGPGERVGQALADSPDVDLISLTGGLEAGPALMRGAAGNVKRVALELGGKSPNIVFADADFETAVDNALTAAFAHSGQVCSAGCRAIVEDAIYDRFVEPRSAGGPTGSASGHGTRRRDRGRRADLRRAPRQGRGLRRVARSRRAPGSSPAAADRRSPSSRPASIYRPTVFADVDRDMRDHPRGGLRAGPDRRAVHDRGRGDRARQRHDLRPGRRRLDGRRRARAQRVAARLRHGTVWINDYNTYLPAGGVGRLQAVRASVGNLARAVWTSTVRPSTSGRTRRRVPQAGSAADARGGHRDRRSGQRDHDGADDRAGQPAG